VLQYTIRKVLAAIPIVLAVSLIVFVILHMTPGDPIRILIGFGSGGYSGGDIEASQMDVLRAKWGLDQPLHIQYLKWLGNILRGDMGNSIRFRSPVWPLIQARLMPTILLGLFAYAIAIAMAFPLGIISALRQNSVVDYSSTGFSLFGMSMPSFWLGLMLIFLLSLKWRLLPTSGMGGWKTFIMPGFVMGFGLAGGLTRMIRSSLLEVLRQDYITTARSKGLIERVVIVKHAFRNASIPIVTMFGFYLAYFLSGAVLTETIFAWPGLGRLAYQSLSSRDYPVVQAIVLIGAVCVVLANLITDLIYGFVDPRIRYD